MASIDEINKCIIANNATLTADIKNEITNVRNELLSKISEISTSFNKDIVDVRETTSLLQIEVTKLQKHCVQQDDRISRLDDMYQRLEKKQSLIIRNLPVFPNENLQSTFASICATIKCELPVPLPVLFRIKSKNKNTDNTRNAINLLHASSSKRVLRSKSTNSMDENIVVNNTKSPPMVVVKFALNWQKNLFFNKYFEYGKLTLNNVASTANIPIRIIIICEHLTTNNYSIFRSALEAKLKGFFSKVSTFNGQVQVYDGSNKRLTITNIDELKKLIDLQCKNIIIDDA